jgi:branched-chain amino acid transport system ATP-binding protein
LLERPDLLRSIFLSAAVATGEEAEPSKPKPRRNGRQRDRDLEAFSTVAPNGRVECVPSAVERDRARTQGVTKQFTATSKYGLLTGFSDTVQILAIGNRTPQVGFVFASSASTPARCCSKVATSLVRGRRSGRATASLARSRTPGCSVRSPCRRVVPRPLRYWDPIPEMLYFPNALRAERRLGKRADELVAMMGLDDYRDKFVSDLSTGSRRIVDLACQIGIDPKVILFDEPSSGIAQRETEALGPLLTRIRDITGAAILLIEHDMPLITAVSDRIVACELGRVVVEGDAQLVLNHPQVVASYLGTTREVIERSDTVQKVLAPLGGTGE